MNMPDPQTSWPWLAAIALGAFHGLNPAMGWLFAVALGLQERKLRAVTAALGPIALGHLLATGATAAVVLLLGVAISPRLALPIVGAVLLGFAAFKVITRFRHPRWVGMRVTARDLVLWSFLMASAHGAGLMLAPLLLSLGEAPSDIALASGHAGHAAHFGHHSGTAGDAWLPALLAVGLHALAMLAVAAAIAAIVYQVVGVEILRRAWINLDLLWIGALAMTGGTALLYGLWSLASL